MRLLKIGSLNMPRNRWEDALDVFSDIDVFCFDSEVEIENEHIHYIKFDTNTFAKNINNYSCDYYESYEPIEVCENVREIFSKYNIDNEDNLLIVGCNKDYILDFRLVGNAIGGIEIFRLYNPNDGDHLLTTSINERKKLEDLGWECNDSDNLKTLKKG